MADAPPTDPPAPTPTPVPTPTPPAAPPAPPVEPSKDEGKLTVEAAEKLIADLRREAAGHRTEKQTARQERDELINKVAQALGLKDETPKPEQLQGQISTLAGENKRLKGELLVRDAAEEHKVNPELTAAVLLHRGAFNDFDPDNAESVAGLKAAIKGLADTMPALRTAPSAPGKSGGNPPSGGEAAKPQGLHEALTARLFQG